MTARLRSQITIAVRAATLLLICTSPMLVGPAAEAQEPASQPCGAGSTVALALVAEASTVSVNLKTSASRAINVVLRSNCRTDLSALGITGRLDPQSSDVADFPSSIVLGRPRVDGDNVTFRLPVDRATFGPGNYDALLVVSGSSLDPVRIPIAARVKDDSWAWPVGISIIGLLIGLFISAFGVWSSQDNPTPSSPWKGTLGYFAGFFGLAAVAVAVAAIVQGPFRTLYIDSLDWYNETDQRLSLLVATATAAAGANVVALFARGLRRTVAPNKP